MCKMKKIEKGMEAFCAHRNMLINDAVEPVSSKTMPRKPV